jgi:hypothetical protein
LGPIYIHSGPIHQYVLGPIYTIHTHLYRRNFTMSAIRRPRNLMGMKPEDEENGAVAQPGKVARDLRKKYGGIAMGTAGKRGKRGVPVELLAEMQEIFNRHLRGWQEAAPGEEDGDRARSGSRWE